MTPYKNINISGSREVTQAESVLTSETYNITKEYLSLLIGNGLINRTSRINSFISS